MKEEAVNHPKHYTCIGDGKYEPLDVIESWRLDHHEACAVKYIARAKYKGKECEDLEKAVVYLNRKISILKKQSVKVNLEVIEKGSTNEI